MCVSGCGGVCVCVCNISLADTCPQRSPVKCQTKSDLTAQIFWEMGDLAGPPGIITIIL